MSLNNAERQVTRLELQANFQLAGSDGEQVQRALGFSTRQFDDTLNVTPGSDPADVWVLRDYLELLVRQSGVVAVPYTVLTDHAREAAARWLTLRTPPSA